MDRDAVLVKTGKGTEEVKSRTHGLAARLRSVLIMVDGNSTVADYVARFGAIPDIEGSLQTLVDQEFVAICGVRARAPAAAQAVAGAPAAALAAQRKEALAQLRMMLTDALGPSADMITTPIDRAKTRADFSAAAERGAQVLDSMGARGKALAARARALAQAIAEQFFPG